MVTATIEWEPIAEFPVYGDVCVVGVRVLVIPTSSEVPH